MSAIQTPPERHPVPATPLSAAASAAAGGATAATPAGIAAPMPAEISSAQLEMANLLEESGGDSSSAAEADDGDAAVKSEPVSNTNSAPWLPPPGTMMSADYLAMMCSFYNSKSAENQLAPLQQQVKSKTRQQLDELQRSNEIIAKNIEAAKKAAAARKSHGILGWIRKAVTIVAAVVAVAAITFAAGPASPLVMAVAIGCLLNAVMSLSSDVSSALGGPPLPNSLSSALQMGLTCVLQQFLDDDLAAGLGMMLSGLIGCFAKGGVGVLVDPSFAGQLVGGAAMLGGTGEAKTAEIFGYTTMAAAVVASVVVFTMTGPQDLQGTVDRAIKATNALSGLSQAALGIYQAKLTVEIGDLQARQMRFQAANQEISALISRLQSQWSASKDEMARVIDSLNSINGIIADILNGEAEQKSGMLAQWNGRATV